MKVICDYCKKDAVLVSGDIIYPHRPDLYKLKFWQCSPCKAHVGCHKSNPKRKMTGLEPLGRLATNELRRWKSNAHNIFDPLWKKTSTTRPQAYFELSNYLGIEREDCHIGNFDIETCKKVIEYSKEKRGL